ncbi:MAG: hypothetical protein IPL53_24345 [Ignavibacteria bacterium]|nr:hypothetical protein [Ignavibacteria bacterium]
MLKIRFKFIVLFFCAIAFSCKDEVVSPDTDTETLLYQYDGYIEDIGGDCSAVQVRTRSYGTFDLTNTDRIKFNFDGNSDADLSSISFYYFNSNDEQVFIVNLTDMSQIFNTKTVEVDSPRMNTEIFSRVTLKSSVCTGHIYYLYLRDLKIYSITE